MTASKEEASGGGRRSKVARLIEEYELEGLGQDLEDRWTAEEDRLSLRALADLFNKRLVERAMAEANIQVLDGEIDNIYRLLNDDSVSEADRTRVRRRLERDGLDVDGLETDFVTYQAIRTYLKKDRGAEYQQTDTDPIERQRTNIQQLRGRLLSVTEGNLEQLRKRGDIDLGDFRTTVDVQVVCEDCNTHLDIGDLLDRGGCDCPTE